MANTKVTTNVIADDAITGAKIADDAINSEHYTDGSIDTAHIADDQVTLAKMAGLARGKIIYGDSSGNPAALAVGSNGQVLKSDGTDIAWGTDSSNDRDGAAVFNESGADVDFRVESNGNTHMLFVDGGTNSVGIGGTPTNAGVSGAASPVLAIIGTVPELNFVDTSTSANDYWIRVSDGLQVGEGSDSRLYLKNGGNVGIGTTSPSTKLYVYDASAATHIRTNSDITQADGTVFGKLSFQGEGNEEISLRAFYDHATSAYSGLSFHYDGASGTTEAMRIDSSGNVGIGVTPSYKLHVKTTSGGGTWPIRVEASADNDLLFGVYESSNGDGNNGMLYLNDGGGTTDVKISTNGASWFNGGNVGIGTDSPARNLVVSSSGQTDLALVAGTSASAQLQFGDSGDDNIGQIEYNNSSNYMAFFTNASEAMRITSDGQFLMGATAAVDGERAAISKVGTCKLLIHCTENSSARDAILSMHTVNGGSQNRINFADGAGAGTGSGQFYYNHDGNTMYWITGGTENMTLDSSGNLTIQGSYSPSDGRLKENIEDFSYDIEKFKAYSPKTFDWINPEEHGGRTQQIGFIAQEQEVIDPRFIEEVETDADRKDTLLLDQITKLDGDVKGISKTSEFVQKDAMYISVIQQLITRLEAAEAKITALEG